MSSSRSGSRAALPWFRRRSMAWRFSRLLAIPSKHALGLVRRPGFADVSERSLVDGGGVASPDQGRSHARLEASERLARFALNGRVLHAVALIPRPACCSTSKCRGRISRCPCFPRAITSRALGTFQSAPAFLTVRRGDEDAATRGQFLRDRADRILRTPNHRFEDFRAVMLDLANDEPEQFGHIASALFRSAKSRPKRHRRTIARRGCDWHGMPPRSGCRISAFQGVEKVWHTKLAKYETFESLLPISRRTVMRGRR